MLRHYNYVQPNIPQLETGDSHLARYDRRHPFRPLNEIERAEIRIEANAILRGIWPMLRGLARRIMPESSHRAGLVEDAMQETALHLATYSFGMYDAHYRPRTKVTTWLHRCARNYLFGLRKQAIRDLRREVPTFDQQAQDLRGVVAADTLLDRHIERLADIARRDPESLGLTTSEARAVRAVVAAEPFQQMRDVARAVGYRNASSLPSILMKARHRLRELDLEGVNLRPTKKQSGELDSGFANTIIVQPEKLFTLEQAVDWLNEHGSLLRPVKWHHVTYWVKTRFGVPDSIRGKPRLYAIETLQELAPMILASQQTRRPRKTVAMGMASSR